MVALAACSGGGAAAPSTEPRASGQSRLIEKTFAGKNRCSSDDHTRPFIVEWDATDMSSFEARATTDAIFVRYDGCKLDVVDTCTNDSVRGALGAYGPVDWTSGSVEKVDILDEDELYAKLPLGVNTIGGRVRSGERFHMEYFVSGTRKATRPAVYRAELDAVPGCRGVTHFVYAYNVGAFALGSLARLEGSAGATLWGIGAGANRTNQSAIEKQAGVLASCRGESATEVSTCKVPIRLNLRAIEPGENPDKRAAAAPETADALNLAGKLQASNERSREANERATSAQRKLAARDGKGCLAELDAYDRLEGKGSSPSTEPKGLGGMRAVCLMLAGQCTPGRDLMRRTRQAQAPGDSPSTVDRAVDQQVAYYCGTAAKDPRDKLLVALATVDAGARSERIPAARCSEAIETALAALDKVKPRDEQDSTIKNAARSLAENGAKCLARSGECVQAWRRYPALIAAWNKAEKYDVGKDPKSLRDQFERATYGECAGKDPGPLTPVEDLARSVVELEWVAKREGSTAATCQDLITRGKRALASVAGQKPEPVPYAASKLREEGAACLAKKGDCLGSRAFYLESVRAERPDTKLLQAEDSWGDEVRSTKCSTQLAPGLPAEAALAQSLRAINRARMSHEACAPAWEAIKASVSALRDREVLATYESELNRRPGWCFREIGKCNEAWTAEKTANAWLRKPREERELVASFVSDGKECNASTPGLTQSEQFWAAFALMRRGDRDQTPQECSALRQVTMRTASSVKLRPERSDDDPEQALGTCLLRAKDCAGARQAFLRSHSGKDAKWVESVLRNDCRGK